MKLAAAAGVVAVGLSAAPAATAITAVTPQAKCDPDTGMRVAYSSSGEEKVKAKGCVRIKKLDDGQWKVAGSVRAKAYSTRGSDKWRLAKHPYQLSCEIRGRSGLTGFATKSGDNAASVSDGTTDGSCAEATLPSGSYVFAWSYDRRADKPSSAVSTDGEVEFKLRGDGTNILIRPILGS